MSDGEVTNLVLEIAKDIDVKAFMDKYDESKGLKIVKNDSDNRLKDLTEVDFIKVRIGSCFKKEDPIGTVTGFVKLERLKAGSLIRLGFETFYSLIESEVGTGILEWLYKNYNIRLLDFFGTIFENKQGEKFILFLFRHEDGEWTYNKRSLKTCWSDATLIIPI